MTDSTRSKTSLKTPWLQVAQFTWVALVLLSIGLFIAGLPKVFNAQKTLAAFSASIRDEVDLENLSGSLLKIVQQTMQPERVCLWLRDKV